MDNARRAVARVEVHPAQAGDDPRGAEVRAEVREMGLAPSLRTVKTARVYLIESGLDHAAIERIAVELLADPVSQRPVIGAHPPPDDSATVEVHHKPGVMDPVAQSTRDAIVEMLGDVGPIEVRTGVRYDLEGVRPEAARRIAERLLANTVIQQVAGAPVHPGSFAQAPPYELKLGRVPIRDLDDEALQHMSRQAHLFCSLHEMQAIGAYFREAGREPTDIELETLAQTWSEHCVHKTLKSTIHYRESDQRPAAPGIEHFARRPGHRRRDEGELVIDNLLESTIAAATRQLQADGVDWCLSVFVDNAGIIRFDQTDAITFKVETHNHPSAIEPYGGAATGIGGVIRDTMGTGLAAKPVANTDVFCVARPDHWALAETHDGPSSRDDQQWLARGVLHPRRILKQIVAGVRDYGNRMGIPTVNGAVWFDDRYLGNPLVFCGSVGLIPRDRCFGDPRPGDRIIVLGGRTGRDGIHGATFSSAELTGTHAEEFSHAVQIGNAITEKKMLDVILQARDPRKEDGTTGKPLFNAITDCGAGGFSSAVGEMGQALGAHVTLEQAPLKYAGLSYTEIWISEAQERMVLAVPPDKVQALGEIADREDVLMCDLGHYGTDGEQLILTYDGTEVGRLSMDFLHNGLPQPTREAHWAGPPAPATASRQAAHAADDLGATLIELLGHPNIASKHWIIRQYDHEVQGGAAVRPLTGSRHDGPADAAVLRPKLDSQRGVAVSCGLATTLGDVDPYWMALAAIDEAVRNAVCAGARADRIAILDNFCWPSCDSPDNLGSLVRAAEACYDGAIAYRTPFISGKDSLNNQFTTDDGRTIAIPPTLLISAVGIVDDVDRCVTMDAKAADDILLQVGATTGAMGVSHFELVGGACGSSDIPRLDLDTGPRTAAAVAELIGRGLVGAAHDCSEGGMLVAAAEMAFAGDLGLAIDLAAVPAEDPLADHAACFAETPGRYLIEIPPHHFDEVVRALRQAGVAHGEIGTFNTTARLTVRSAASGRLADVAVDELRQAWRQPLDW